MMLYCPNDCLLAGISEYVQGVEVATEYNGIVPDGLDVIELPKN